MNVVVCLSSLRNTLLIVPLIIYALTHAVIVSIIRFLMIFKINIIKISVYRRHTYMGYLWPNMKMKNRLSEFGSKNTYQDQLHVALQLSRPNLLCVQLHSRVVVRTRYLFPVVILFFSSPPQV